MNQIDLSAIHTTLIGFTKRAEKATDETLVATFVDSAPLFSLLSTENNQVIYGRRGTGKTHALKVLSEHVEQKRDGIPVFLDMRTIGSNGSIYADSSRPLSERASVLLSDALSGLMNEFYTIALTTIERHPHPEEVTRRLDVLQESISTIKINGDVGEERTDVSKTQSGASGKVSLAPGAGAPISAELGSLKNNETSGQRVVKRSGRESIHLTFGSIAGALRAWPIIGWVDFFRTESPGKG